MNTELAELREQRLSVREEIKGYADKQTLTEDEIKRFDELENNDANLEKQIASLERIEKAKAQTSGKTLTLSAPAIRTTKNISRGQTDKALRAWLTRNTSSFSNDYADAASNLGFNYQNDSQTFKLYGASELIERQQSTVVGEGGYSINGVVVSGFERALKSFWNWQDFVTVRRTAGGAPIAILTNNDTGNEGAYLSELSPVVNVSTTFNRTTLNAYKISSGIFPVSNELLEDSSEDISSIVGYNLGVRIARKLGREFTLGTGSGDSHVTGFTTQTTSAGETFYKDAIVWEDLVDLFYSVDEAYRSSPSCAWMMSSATLASLVKSVDQSNRPLYQSNYQDGPRMSLLGKAVIVNDFLPSTLDAGDKLVYFGDWSKYVARIARDVTMQTSREKYFLEDAVATIATVRIDGKLIDAGQHPIKHLVQNTASGAPSIDD